MAEAEKELVISPQRKILRFCLVSLIVVVCVYVTLYASVLMLAARKEAEIKQRLKDLVPNVEQLADQRASVEENETARMMREWGEKQSFFGATMNDLHHSEIKAQIVLDNFWLKPLSQRETMVLQFGPFVDFHQDFLKKLHPQVDLSPPRFRAKFDEAGESEGLEYAYSKVFGVLLLDVLLKIKRNELGSAFHSFQTAWIIVEAYRTYPSVLARIYALQYQTYLVQIVKELNSFPLDWQLRISEFDYKPGWKELEAVRLWRHLQFLKKKSNCYWLFSPRRLLGKYGHRFADIIWPYFWLCAVNSTEIILSELESIWSYTPRPCWGSKVDLIETNHKFPVWNKWSGHTWRILNPFGQVARLEFETERTRVILHLRELQQKSPAGKLPVTLPKMESKVCPGEYWEFQPQPDGTVILKFSQPIEDSEFKL